MDRTPRPGSFYRHFKDKLYQVLAVAEHTETGEELVIYQALYGDFRIYARPAAMFTSEVDHERYPDVRQRYRFEEVDMRAEAGLDPRTGRGQQVEPRQETGSERETGSEQETGSGREAGPGLVSEAGPSAEGRISAWMERFLDAEGYEAQLEALNQMWGRVSQRELDNIYLILDIGHMEGDEDSQLRGIMRHLETRMRYDGGRLRRPGY